ncbi:hypothetical protein SUGI_0407690 [Cryptomeria japonica]|uniref:disease resistance protein TAO1 n=1 Tax=Cryptomeria japonica TaxID=3369 RepID=UPI002408D6E3|nr:disease resistance protein TAO1 [Cryptomeria japonica]GLJ21820.1 hypothetical protein SUGI_0407690 [Cryptomeria japonica]
MSQNPSSLVELDLSGCQDIEAQLPTVNRLSNLQILRLDQCETLIQLPSELCNLLSVKDFSARRCPNLKELPSNFGNLKNLEILNLSHCTGLGNLPSSFGTLTSLQRLDLSFCDALKSLPETFANLSSLQILNLEFCQNLVNLPSNFGNLCSLETLELSGCEDLERLPVGFGSLKSLRCLRFLQDRSICSGMETLPESFGDLSSLEELSLRCPNLENLPQTFGGLKTLRCLDLSGCENLRSLPENFGALESLKILNVQFCNGLQTVGGDFESLISLKAVNAADCDLIGSALDKFVGLKGLMLLYIAGSRRLIERWKQVKGEYVLWVICQRPAAEVDSFDWDGFELVARETKSTAFFHHGYKFLSADGNVEDNSFLAFDTKLAFLFAKSKVSSSSSLEMLKKKFVELASQSFHLIYVPVWEQSKEDIQQTVVSLLSPGVKARAWVGSEGRSRDIFGFSVIFGEVSRKREVERLGAFIVTVSVSVDEEGNKSLGDLESVFPEEEDGDAFKALLDDAGGFRTLYDPIFEVIELMMES